MKYKIIGFTFICLLIAHQLFSSFAESYKIDADILEVLTTEETEEILKSYHPNEKKFYKMKYNVGIEIEITKSEAKSGSHTHDKFEDGDILKIVVSSNTHALDKLLTEDKEVKLRYSHYSGPGRDGKMSIQTSWEWVNNK